MVLPPHPAPRRSRRSRVTLSTTSTQRTKGLTQQPTPRGPSAAGDAAEGKRKSVLRTRPPGLLRIPRRAAKALRVVPLPSKATGRSRSRGAISAGAGRVAAPLMASSVEGGRVAYAAARLCAGTARMRETCSIAPRRCEGRSPCRLRCRSCPRPRARARDSMTHPAGASAPCAGAQQPP